MCVIITYAQVIKNKEAQKMVNDAIGRAKQSNSDGIGLVAFNKAGTVHSYREMDKDSEGIARVVDKFANMIIHLRLATSGNKNVDNVHFWQWGNWYFAHNGIISGLMGNKEKSDSLLFFEEICTKGYLKKTGMLNHTGIARVARLRKLNGRFVLFNSDLRVGYYFGDWWVYKLKNGLVVSSTSIDFIPKVNFYGFNLDVSPDIVLSKKIASSIFMIDFVGQTSHVIEEEFDNWGYQSKFGFSDDDGYEDYNFRKGKYNWLP